MSHTDFITPFTVEETLEWPDDKLPEPRIDVELFTELLLKRWPHTGKPDVKQVDGDVYHYYYDFRRRTEDYPWELSLNYSCFVTIKRANQEILASLCYIYRQCVPNKFKAYLVYDEIEILPDSSEEEILKTFNTKDNNNAFGNNLPDAL